MKTKIKPRDVFKFRYSEEYRKEAEKRWYSGYLSHCFEGTLVAREYDGDIRLVDTFWGIGGDGKSFSEKEAREIGELTFYVNLDDIEKMEEHQKDYYDSVDVFTITKQHACVPSCIAYFKKKGAKKSAAKMLEVINEKMREKRKDIQYDIDALERMSVQRAKIENGDTEAWL